MKGDTEGLALQGMASCSQATKPLSFLAWSRCPDLITGFWPQNISPLLPKNGKFP
jgi:hypothetical protein